MRQTALKHTISGDLTHIACAQFPQLCCYGILLHQGLLKVQTTESHHLTAQDDHTQSRLIINSFSVGSVIHRNCFPRPLCSGTVMGHLWRGTHTGPFAGTPWGDFWNTPGTGYYYWVETWQWAPGPSKTGTAAQDSVLRNEQEQC